MLWSMLYPPRGHRIMPTISGVILISLALGIGTAAYNTANNILFITLSLLLACLILSGLLSWLNLARVAWRLEAIAPWRVGTSAEVVLELRNTKRLLPTYGLWFDVTSTSQRAGTRLALRERLEPRGGTTRLPWVFQPRRRGREHVELIAVGSLFPFGFLRKVMGSELRRQIIVWPAPTEYRRHPVSSSARPRTGERVARVGQSGDLFALRHYHEGDSHRLIHWKASARLGKLMVREFSSESQDGFSLWLDPSPARWPVPAQFELMCSLVVTLAEDLFRADQLGSVAVGADAPQIIRRVRDLEAFFDRIALLDPDAPADASNSKIHPPRSKIPGRNLLTFAPDGPHGVAAFLDGQLAASA
jgi:uncharacterized protein (DUF58 family)